MCAFVYTKSEVVCLPQKYLSNGVARIEEEEKKTRLKNSTKVFSF